MSWILRPVTILIVCGLGAHAATLFAVHRYLGDIDVFAFQSLDSSEYVQIAENLANHGAFSQSNEAPFEPDTWRTPGYPVFLAGLIKVAGASPVALVVAQQVLAIVNVLLAFAVSRIYMSPWRAALVALVVLVEPFHLYYSLWLLATTLFVTVLLLTWYAFERASEDRGGWRSALVGVLCGLLVLVRPVAMLVPLVVFLGLCLPRSRGGESKRAFRKSWQRAAVCVMVCAVVISAWMMRNRVVAGHFALSHQGGIVLAYFKAAEVELWRQGKAVDRYVETSLSPARANDPHEVWDEIDGRLRVALAHLPEDQRGELSWRNLARGNQTTVDSFEISDALSGVGLTMLFEDPLSTAFCYGTRMGSLLTFPLNQVIRPPTGVPQRRLRWTVMAGPYVVLVLASLMGIIRRWRAGSRAARGDGASADSRQDRHWLPALMPAYFPLAATIALLVATTPQIDPRFRVPLIPLLAFLAMLPPRSAIGNATAGA